MPMVISFHTQELMAPFNSLTDQLDSREEIFLDQKISTEILAVMLTSSTSMEPSTVMLKESLMTMVASDLQSVLILYSVDSVDSEEMDLMLSSMMVQPLLPPLSLLVVALASEEEEDLVDSLDSMLISSPLVPLVLMASFLEQMDYLSVELASSVVLVSSALTDSFSLELMVASVDSLDLELAASVDSLDSAELDNSLLIKQEEPSLTSVMDLVLLSSEIDLVDLPLLSMVVPSKVPQLSELVSVEPPLPLLQVDGADITPQNKHLLTAHQDSHVLMDFALTSTLTLPNLNLVMPLVIDSKLDQTHSSPLMKDLA